MSHYSLYKVGSNGYKKVPKAINPIYYPLYYLIVVMWIASISLGIKSAKAEAKVVNPYIPSNTTPSMISLSIGQVDSTRMEGVILEAKETKLSKEERVRKLETFLEEQNSPLAPYAEYIVEQADKYDISWTLVSSISGKESSFGKAIKPNSHNAWGIMAWDKEGKRYIRSFDNWKEGIAFTSKLLSEHYRENMNRAIQQKYCPSFECSDTWVATVTAFQKEINQ